jgi:hypothetical protein
MVVMARGSRETATFCTKSMRPPTSEEIRAATVARWTAFRAEHPGQLPIEREEGGGSHYAPRPAEEDRGREHLRDDDFRL